ncbi:hypothetical protein ABW04_27370 [Priestia megaterium]|nr:hypothetical protein ABW04_27370 [Priestia megaterium]
MYRKSSFLVQIFLQLGFSTIYFLTTEVVGLEVQQKKSKLFVIDSLLFIIFYMIEPIQILVT